MPRDVFDKAGEEKPEASMDKNTKEGMDKKMEAEKQSETLTMPLILASASPRRRSLLTEAGIPFTVIVSGSEEDCTLSDPAAASEQISRGKAEDVAKEYGKDHPDEAFAVLAADTVVVIDGEIIGKPADREDAVNTIKRLQGRSHQVVTGVALWKQEPGKEPVIRQFHEVTEVLVRPMTEEAIRAYTETGEPMDKAGSYAIQGLFAPNIEGIRGDYSNVVGLPVEGTRQLLREMGILE